MDDRTAGIAWVLVGAAAAGLGVYFYMKDRCSKETDSAVYNATRWYGEQLEAEADVRRAREDHIQDLREEKRALRDQILDMSSKHAPPGVGSNPAQASK